MRKINILLVLIMAIGLLVSCGNVEIVHSDPEEHDWHTATMVMNVMKISFDLTTKATDSWNNGDIVYLLFTKESSKVQGKAVYNATESSWTVRYNGSLRGTSESAVIVWYFDGAGTENSGSLALTPSTGIYLDEAGRFTYPSDGDLVVTGNLKPKTGRIQFKGESALSIEVGGISHYTSFNLSTGELPASDSSVILQVQTDGYTPYIYGTFTDTENRTLNISDGDNIFTANCPTNILQTGKSGWMSIPTADSHNEWIMLDKFNGHAYVDLGLTSGTLWATMNVGASKPEDYGDYFAWGETTGYNSGKTNFDWSTYKWCNGSYTTLTKYCTSSSYGTVDNKTELELSDDAARANWGGSWRMPSSAQINELISECNTEWTSQGGVYGRKVTSKKNGNSIFLPAAGYCKTSPFKEAGTDGYYLSRSLDYDSLDESCNRYAVNLSIDSSDFRQDGLNRYYGISIRPVVSKSVEVTSITLNLTSLTLEKGGSATLTATVLPAIATDKTVKWSTSDAAVALVDDGGVVKYVGDGTAVITVTSVQNSGVKATCTVTCKADKFNGHAYVDLGLTSGTLWATMNVGASSPEDYGDYFAWGETSGYNSGKTNFEWSTYKWCNGSSSTMTKYCTSSSYGTVDNKTELELADDAARANWGGIWRMPSSAQIDELISECNTEWTTQGGVYGRKVTSKKNGNSIFLPAAGYFRGSSLRYTGSDGDYCSRSLHYNDGNDGSCNLFFTSGDFYLDTNGRCYGQSVRPVFQKEINVESVKLDKSTLTLNEGESETLSVTVLPDNATNKSVTWSTSDAAVASVDDGGVVKYAGDGMAVITAASVQNSGVKATCTVTCKADKFNGHAYVDLGLTSGTLWATMNVGASKPEEYGDYFAWGETTGYNSGKTNFDWSTYKWCNGSSSTMTKYCTSSSYGTVDNKTELELSDDAARANWGGSWRMPSRAQIDELISECNTEWTTQGGVYGGKVTSKKNGNSIFLPASGYRGGSSLYEVGSYGLYWSRSLYSSYCYHAYDLDFNSGYCIWFSNDRYYGQSVRPVASE